MTSAKRGRRRPPRWWRGRAHLSVGLGLVNGTGRLRARRRHRRISSVDRLPSGRSASPNRPSERPCDHQRQFISPHRMVVPATRSLMTTSAPASCSAAAHRVAFSRKNGSSVPATRYARGNGPGNVVGRLVPGARRGGEHRAVDTRMPEPDGERELPTRRHAEHRGACGRQRDAEPRPRPSPDVLHEEPLVRREPLRVEARRVLLEPLLLVRRAMDADDHGGRDARRLEGPTPLETS